MESVASSTRHSRDEPHIRELVVAGVVNMLQANTDAGSKHCLSLGFDNDIHLRVMFCQIWARALQPEHRLKLEGLGDARVTPQRNQLCEVR